MPAHDTRAYALEWAARRHVSGLFDSSADPTGSAFTLRKANAAKAQLLRGVVVNAFPYLQAYLVSFEFMDPKLVCVLGTQTSTLAIGAKQLNTLIPGTHVWVAWTPQMTYGVITMVEPHSATDPALARSDWIHATSRCGFHVDKYAEAVLQTNDSAGLLNWACGRPMDSLPVGEYGAIAETGLAITLDSFMGQVRADESTGLFVCYHDQFVRLAGVNLQEFSGGHVREHLNDQGEIRIYSGWTPYAWEQLGALRPGVDPSRAVTADEVQNTKQHLAAVEPRHDDQIPFHRRVFLGGYVGQGGKDLIALPPPSGDVLRRSDANTAAKMPPGVLEEQRTLPGAYMLRSAKGVHLMKQPAIPVPIPAGEPEDLTGDTSENYKFSGRDGSGDAHKVAPRIETTDPDALGQRIAGLVDELALRRNWEGQHALHYHKKDWKLQEEQDTALAQGYKPPELDKLVDGSVLPLPASVQVKVDDRYGAVTYYLNEASISIFDEGAIVLQGGAGERLVLGGGNAMIDVPGDLFIRTGKSIIQWSGRDIISRARNCVDISSSLSDVRLKAEKELHVLAGNGGTGGLLLESRGSDAYDFKNKTGTDVTGGGIALKATNGSIVGWGKGLYLRSLHGGSIVLDADKGKGDVVAQAAKFSRYIQNSAYDYFGPAGSVAATNSYSGVEARIGTPVALNGSLTVRGSGLFNGNVDIMQGHVYSEQAGDSSYVGSYGKNKTVVTAFKDRLQQTLKDSKADGKAGVSEYKGTLNEAWYKTGQPGDDKTIDTVAFSFRSTEQYRAKDFSCWETAWQQIARETNLALATWTEPAVKVGSRKTMPFPGEQRLKQDKVYLQQKLKLYDWNRGVAMSRKDNTAAYETPTFGDVTRKTIDGNYVVVDSPK
jgi:hypothetical protein